MSSLIDVETTNNKPQSLMAMAEAMQHEQILYFSDAATGLKGFIGVHDTTLGPALGGCRIWNYNNIDEALTDVLRLSRGMTYKSSISGINLGGGKSVIINNQPGQRTEAFWKRFGTFVESMGGKYITAEDVGTSTAEIVHMMQVTNHVSGKPVELGGGGDPSPFTAYGVFLGLKAAAKSAFGSDDLNGKKVLVQGVGHVGRYLVEHLTKHGAKVFISDIKEDKLKSVAAEFGASVLQQHEVIGADVDIYAPCALGGALNASSIPQLKCAVVAGAANNQLADEDADGEALLERGIVYAPDFLINAGGVINCYQEVIGYDEKASLQRTEAIYAKTIEVIQRSSNSGISTHKAAMEIALERIENAKKERKK